jgi:hypothetical protein
MTFWLQMDEAGTAEPVENGGHKNCSSHLARNTRVFSYNYRYNTTLTTITEEV